MKYLYTVAFYLALPFILLRTTWRARKRKDQLKRLGERLGFYKGEREKNSIWLHAVSYGEVVAAESLLKRLKALYPAVPIVITTMTLTGAIRVNSIWQKDSQIRHLYLPYDIPFAMSRFFDHVNPSVGIIMETELWPNMLYIAGKKKIPLLLANARLSLRSLAGYKKIYALVSPLLRNISYIAAQSEQDAERFIELGSPQKQVTVLGNLKFDITPSDKQITESQEIKKLLPFDSILIAASTHANEEEQLLDIYERLREKFGQLLLIIVPRHPERFDDVAHICQKRGHRIARRSFQELPVENTSVFLGDTMGELYFFYGLADLAFVGGSLVPVGGHNLLEPAALKLPIVTGPHLFNFTAISQMLKDTKTLHIGATSEELYAIFYQLLKDKTYCQQVGQQGFEILEKNRGATDRHLEVVSNWLPQSH
jgi:3-deoxy-D-manno-octulosonic-acid transferase